jgi:hypothetical protein
MRNAKQYRLELGQQIDVVISVFSRSIALAYTGQLQDYVYSIAVIQSKGNNSYAYNVYFNADQHEFRLLNGTVKIFAIDAQHIEFAYIRD